MGPHGANEARPCSVGEGREAKNPAKGHAKTRLDPKNYTEKGRFDQPDASGKNTWPPVVVANGKMYLRDQDVLLCYDVKAK